MQYFYFVTLKTTDMRTIGFATQYYTLWEVGEPYMEPVYYGTLKIGECIKQDITYLKNLSTDLEKAKAKLQGKYAIDLELRGTSSFTRTISSSVKDRQNYYPMNCFSFGWYEGCEFSKCDNVWQLKRAMNEEDIAERRQNAKNRLIELGAIVEYNGEWITPDDRDELIRKRAFESKMGFHFADGQKVELLVQLIPDKSFWFDTQYGTTYVRYYIDQQGRVFKYMGGSPPDIREDDGFVKISATIKHDNYRGIDECKLQRIKISKDNALYFKNRE